MPKDATKNVDRYKVRGGELNEFDFHQKQEDYAAEKKSITGKKLIPVKATKTTKATKTARKAAKKK